MHENFLIAAIQKMRARLHLRQADLAQRLGCKQNTVSKYELAKAHPGMEILVKIWGLADAEERALIQKYLYEQFMLSGSEQQTFSDRVLSLPVRHFSLDLAAVLSRPEAPSFLRRIISLYLQFKKHPETQRTFEQAVAWLEVQFQMLDYAEKVGSSTPDDEPDLVGMELRIAAEEPLVRAQPILRRARVPKSE